MKKFELKSSNYVDENGVIYITLRPTDIFIENYLASNHELTNRADIDGQILLLIQEMTPILFAKFQELDSVPEFIKNEFEL